MDQAKRTLTIIAGSFAGAGISIVLVLSALDLGDPASPDLAEGAALAAAVFGAIGLVAALIWASRSGEGRPSPNSVTVGFIIRVALAELGLLIGILGLFMTGSVTPSYIGLGFFLASLLALSAGLRRVD